MNGPRLGRGFRVLRHRLGWRQQDLADRVGVSQDLVSLIERGHLRRTTIASLEQVAAGLDAELVVLLRWRAGELDRLLDAAHAALVADIAGILRARGWRAVAEVTYRVYGERGSIDLLAWHPATRRLLVVEVKSELTSLEGTLRRHDEKVRLASAVARDRLSWDPAVVTRLLVLPDSTTARRRVRRHASILDPSYPLRGAALRRWLRDPRGPVAGGLLFLPLTTVPRGRRGSTGLRRIRRVGSSVDNGPRPPRDPLVGA